MSVESERQLARIADALEGIDHSLTDMQEVLEALKECVVDTDHGTVMHISGDITHNN